MPGPQTPDESLFDALFERHRRAVFGYLYGQTGQRDTASDLLQDAFVRVWKHIADARPLCDDHRLFWILRLARSALIDFRRRSAVRADLEFPVPSQEIGVPSHQETVIDRATIDGVDAAIAELPVELRTVLTMSVLGGLARAEIGQASGRPAGTVRSQLSDARKRIARKVGLC